VIYLDTSVALAELFAEDRRAPVDVWREPLVSSRMLQYELWNRVHARGAGGTHGEAARAILARVSMVELLPSVLTRALDPFPTGVRTLDGLHLATLGHLVDAGQVVRLATLDARTRAAARSLGYSVAF
jgi:hypothetical protein